MTLSQAVEKIRGEKGTTVELTLLHKDEEKTRDVKIIRDVITVKSVQTWIKKGKDIDAIELDKKYAEANIAYVSLSQFGDNTNSEWLSAINEMNLSLGKTKVEGIILSLCKSVTQFAMAYAAATFMLGVILRALISNAPLKIPGNANTLLI